MDKFQDIRGAAFDLDGTLLNTLEDLRDSTNFALRTYGYPERSLEEVRRFVGNGLKMLLTRAVPQGSSEVEIERALACMKAHYCENYAARKQNFQENNIPASSCRPDAPSPRKDG